jgi:hypothetical protein
MRAASSLVLVAICALLGSAGGCSKGKSSSQAEAKGATQGSARAQAVPERPNEAGAKEAAGAPPVARKIIYTADLVVIVEDFASAEKDVTKLVKAHHGFVAQSDISSSPGAPRSGRWRARVPVTGFEAFRAAIAALGEVEKNSSEAEDVTDKFYDLQKRIKNKLKEEERLLEHLQKSTGKLAEILQVEKELSRVREEAELMQGQQERLANLSSLTTINVALHERNSYVPAEAAGFDTRIGRTFEGSVNALAACGRAVVLSAVAVAPWLALLAVPGVPALVLYRRRRALPVASPLTTAGEHPPGTGPA